MNNKVYIVQCRDYAEADEKIKSLLDMMGGMGRFAKHGEKIVLKANLLREAKPETAVCTHPAVVAAVAALVRKEGADAVIADSPGGGVRYNEKTLEKIYRTSGMHQAAQQTGIELNRDTTSRPASYAEGILTKHFDIITPVYESDAVFQNRLYVQTQSHLGALHRLRFLHRGLPGASRQLEEGKSIYR